MSNELVIFSDNGLAVNDPSAEKTPVKWARIVEPLSTIMQNRALVKSLGLSAGMFLIDCRTTAEPDKYIVFDSARVFLLAVMPARKMMHRGEDGAYERTDNPVLCRSINGKTPMTRFVATDHIFQRDGGPVPKGSRAYVGENCADCIFSKWFKGAPPQCGQADRYVLYSFDHDMIIIFEARTVSMMAAFQGRKKRGLPGITAFFTNNAFMRGSDSPWPVIMSNNGVYITESRAITCPNFAWADAPLTDKERERLLQVAGEISSSGGLLETMVTERDYSEHASNDEVDIDVFKRQQEQARIIAESRKAQNNAADVQPF